MDTYLQVQFATEIDSRNKLIIGNVYNNRLPLGDKSVRLQFHKKKHSCEAQCVQQMMLAEVCGQNAFGLNINIDEQY